MYYGWFVVTVAAFVYALIMGTTFSAFGLFVVPVSEELGLSRAEMNTALILLNIGSAVLAPGIGRLLDRVPARRVMIASALLAGFSFVALSMSTSLWLGAFVMAVTLAAAVQGAGTLTMSVLLARWFTVRRGRAMMLAFMGASMGSVLVVPAIGWLMEREGWRTTLLTMGIGVTILLLLPALIVRERPRPGELEGMPAGVDTGEARAAASATTKPAPIGSLLRMPQFWTIGIGCSLALATIQAIIVTLVPLAVGAGLTTMQAASLVSVTGGAAVASKLLLAIVADRFDRVYLLTGLFTLGIAVNVLMLFGDGYGVLTACAIMLGVSSSAISPILYALIADRFGIASFGTVRGLMAPLIALTGAFAIRAAGEVFDRTGSYDRVFFAFMAVSAVAVMLILATRFTAASARR